MPLGLYSLNGLHAFATAARHLNFRQPWPVRAWPLVRDALLDEASDG